MRFNPQYLEHCSALVALSAFAAVSQDLTVNLTERLDWFEVILGFIDTNVSLLLS